jgi:hypothetical protein
VSRAWIEPVRSLLEAPAPAVPTTYRKDASAHTLPVWFRWTGEAFEVVIAKGAVKLGHLARDPRCVLVVFETVRPFRGVEVRGAAELIEGDATSARVAIAGRYLGVEDGQRFAPSGAVHTGAEHPTRDRPTPGDKGGRTVEPGPRAGARVPACRHARLPLAKTHRLKHGTPRLAGLVTLTSVAQGVSWECDGRWLPPRPQGWPHP